MLSKNPIYIVSILFATALGILYLDTNTSLFFAINATASRFNDLMWILITSLGDKPIALCVVFLLFWRKQFLLRATLIAAAFATFISWGMKPLIALLRPSSVLDTATFQLIGEPLVSYSFPSAHAIAAFAILGAIAFYYQHLAVTLIILILASLIGVSRIAVGAHWPIDVLAGAALGWVCAWLGNYLIEADLWRDNDVWNYLTYAVYLLLAAYLFWQGSHFAELFWASKALAVITIITVLWSFIWLKRGGNKDPVSVVGWLS